MNEDQIEYAGFWRRLGAFFVDFLCLIPIIALNFIFEKVPLHSLYLFLPELLFTVWFHIYLVARYGGTPGKLILGIKIQKIDGTAVDLPTSAMRYSVLLGLTLITWLAQIYAELQISDIEYNALSTWTERSKIMMDHMPFWFIWTNIIEQIWVWSEFVVMLTNKRRRSIHDYMAGTVVVRVKKTAAAQAE